jgi:hypothetical protein
MTTPTDTKELDVSELKKAVAPFVASNGEATETPREIVVRHLNEFAISTENHGGTLLGNRWLCRGGALLLAAPTGVGKSSFTMQAGITWALGRPLFGIAPSGELRVLVIQSENDDGDVAEFRDGIFRGMGLNDTERKAACERIQVVCESVVTGFEFVGLVARLVAEHKPDLVIIDPLFAYCGCNVSDQERMSQFLRNWLNPILQEHGCGLILVHHTNKPKSGKEKPDWQAGDFAYLGSGTTEIANWARAVIGIRSIGSHSVFEVILGKRGRRAGLVNDEGDPAYNFFIKHSSTGICWETATEDDFDRGGRPKNDVAGEMVGLLTAEGLTSGDWQKLAKQECGISERSFFRERKTLEKAGRIWRSKVDGKWQRKTT